MSSLISREQITDFERDGFLIIPDVIDEQTLSAVRAACAARVVDLLRRYEKLGRGNGNIGDDFASNLLSLLRAAPEAYQHIDISLPMVQDMKLCLPQWQALFGDEWRREAGVFADESIFRLLSHPNVVEIVRSLVGDEVIASPVQHVRIKPPQDLLPSESQIDANTARTLWHQDEGVVSEAARGVNILTVWLAMSDATIENGCMEAVVGSHSLSDESDAPDFGLTVHCPGKGEMVGEIYIPKERIVRERVRFLVARAGDAVILHKRLIHGAGANRSQDVRWSFDLRYQLADTVTGRDFFPSCLVASKNRRLCDAVQYRRQWHEARDAIISGEREAIFNTRWNKYGTAEICA